MKDIILPAEWEEQSAIQLTWPHEFSDWKPMLEEVIPCFVEIAKAVMKHQLLVVVTEDEDRVREQLGMFNEKKIRFVGAPSNDSWARDHGAISVIRRGEKEIYDFTFNGWGMKYPAHYDNLITKIMYVEDCFNEDVRYCLMHPFVLEGGSIESDGEGTILTTEQCLLSLNRNENLEKMEIEMHLKQMMGAERILWLSSGYLEGDDTDSHVDTLARFVSKDTIAYVKCSDKEDEHYEELKQMEKELKKLKQANGKPYNLVSLPMADAVYDDMGRLPATYANFTIINGAVLMPFYGTAKDEVARKIMQKLFPDREIIGINCLPLIKQHGSLHCVTMQYPKGFIN